jgi:hypothetical protein
MSIARGVESGVETISEWTVKNRALYHPQVKTSWSSHLTPFITITKHTQREGRASETKDTTIGFGIIRTKDETGMKASRCCVNLGTSRRRSELDKIFKIPKLITRARFGH